MTESDITLGSLKTRGRLYGFSEESLPSELLDLPLSNSSSASSAMVLRSSDGSVKVMLYRSAKPDLSGDPAKLVGAIKLVAASDGSWKEVPASASRGCLFLLIALVLKAGTAVALVTGGYG